MNSVASGPCANINYRVALSRSARIKDLIFAHQSQRKRIHQRIAGVARLKFGFSAQIGDTKAISVAGNSADDAFEDGVVLFYLGLCRAGLSARPTGDGPKPQ